MPRPRNPKNEPGRARTAKWREKLHVSGGYETDAVDTAIAAAVTTYLHQCIAEGRQIGPSRVEALERMAAAYLVSQSGDDAIPAKALERVRRRVRREDAEEVAAAVLSDSSYLSALPITP